MKRDEAKMILTEMREHSREILRDWKEPDQYHGKHMTRLARQRVASWRRVVKALDFAVTQL
jgi:hypothetical protein